ncbi:MAG TPA: hypothetical protein VN879_21010 [Candidatus Acidoferrales bacterium]|nr:hypothetical protein [Candidatus Acidoferrales bacterium]
MKYILVLEWPSSSTAKELDILISLEDQIREDIGDHGNVDGHDIGSGEMNIFIFTEDPKSTFERVKNIGSIPNHMSNLKAGYREVGEDDFVPIYPEGLDHFSVI